MPKRIAAAMSLVVFVACLGIGGFEAGNTFGTTVWRALLAMGATLIIGLIVGTMAEKMLAENLKDLEQNLKDLEQNLKGLEQNLIDQEKKLQKK